MVSSLDGDLLQQGQAALPSACLAACIDGNHLGLGEMVGAGSGKRHGGYGKIGKAVGHWRIRSET